MFKKTLLSLFLASASFSSLAQINDIDKTSYAIGTQTGILLMDNVKRSNELGVKINKKELIRGVVDAVENNSSLTYDEALVYLVELDKELQAKETVLLSGLAQENKASGAKYMAMQANLATIKNTSSGIQYKVLKNGSGKKPTTTSDVTVHYKGLLIDGNEFDSSYKRNQPATFNLNGVIKGWTEGLQLMSEGAMYEFTIPSDLAYGDTGNSQIPPGSTLIFIVELLKIN